MKFVKADLKESQEDFHDIYVKQLQNSIRHIKESREMEERFMILEEMLRDERAAGRREERQSILRSFLEDFGSIPPELEKKLFEESDATVLKNWLKIAATSKSIEEFEVKEKIGGIMRYGIPEFRLPKSILDRYYVKMKELGILFRPNFALGGSTGVEDLLRDGYHAVFIGTGTWRPYQLHIPGETFGNVHYGINYLNNPDVYDLGERVLVIGAGNAAMDVARTAIRKGSRHVTVYSITEIPAASPKEVEYAKLDGVEFEYLQTAIEIRDEGAIICDVEWTEDGKLVKKEETARLVPADSIIISISQGPQDRIVNRDKELQVDDRGLLKTDANGETTMPGIFASGDVVTGAKTVVEAVKYSKMIADAMDEYVKTHYE